MTNRDETVEASAPMDDEGVPARMPSAPRSDAQADAAEEAARRLARGPRPSAMIHPPDQTVCTPEGPQVFDPLRLCIFSTIALITWIAGPYSLLVFASVAFVGYFKARRAGLTRSRCYLRDTRLVLAYLALLFAAAVWGIGRLWGLWP